VNREKLIGALAAIVGDEWVHHRPSELIAYSIDGTFQQARPDLVVSPATTEQVAAVVRVAAGTGIPVIPRGAGTSLAGGTIPVGGGLVVNLARMNRVLEVDKVNGVAVVEAGVVTAELQRTVEREGLFYPPDPASLNQSTIGGNVATNAGGPRCLKYGVTRDYVLGLTVVLADGRILRLGGKLIKNKTGYQLVQLFVGSEGTLGIITEVVLKLLPRPRYRATALAVFPRLDDAARSVNGILEAGILPVTLELMDNLTINVVEDYLQAGLPREAEALLILEQDGNHPEAVRDEVGQMAAICGELGASAVQVATDEADRQRLWQARRNKLGEDIVVPRSAIPEMVRRIRQIGQEYGFEIPVFGHAGDGNLHPNIIFDLRRPGELERVERAAAAIFRAALELGGSLTGEHGIGTLKREFLTEALGPDAVEVMRRLKAALDPKGLFNPHKVFPEGDGAEGFLRQLPLLGTGGAPG
jgi:glycolate oxidase